MESTNTPEDYVNFLREVLQEVYIQPSQDVIHPLLEQNLDKLDDDLITVLNNEGRNNLLYPATTEAYSIALGNFSNLIREFHSGNIAINKELAITGYDIILNTFNYDAFPQNWAIIQNNLADVLRLIKLTYLVLHYELEVA
jgi:hypothetical protein